MALVKPKGVSDSLNPTERIICAAWDDGNSIERIARRFGMARDFVSDTVSRLGDGGETRRIDRSIRTGSAQLLAALNANRQAAR